MTNIPTELLRTLIAVVDMRSFTRAAHFLGITQPAVSAQIKRLQVMLGGELLDKSAPGVTLTVKGELVVNFARRLMSINDQILDATTRGSFVNRLRIGLPMDYFQGPITRAVADFRIGHPDVQMQIAVDASESLLRDLRRGEFDLVVAASDVPAQAAEARRSWREENAWAAGSRAVIGASGPVPLAVLGENSLSRRLAVAALEQVGQPYEITYIGGSFAGLVEAVRAGLGVGCWSKRLLRQTGLDVFDSAPPRLPRIPDVSGGVYLRESAEGSPLYELADMIAAAVANPTPAPAGAPAIFASPLRTPAGVSGMC